jgi:hypothetical protein
MSLNPPSSIYSPLIAAADSLDLLMFSNSPLYGKVLEVELYTVSMSFWRRCVVLAV